MEDINKYSNPSIVSNRLSKYLPNTKLYLSTRKGKKYMIQKPDGSYSHFGDSAYQDFTKHQDEEKRRRYLQRSTKIKGNWKADKYSPNNLSIHLLW